MSVENDAVNGSVSAHKNSSAGIKSLRDILVTSRVANGPRKDNSGGFGDNRKGGNGWSKKDYRNYENYLSHHYDLENARQDAHAERTAKLIESAGGAEGLRSVKFHHGTGQHEIQFGSQHRGNGDGGQGKGQQFNKESGSGSLSDKYEKATRGGSPSEELARIKATPKADPSKPDPRLEALNNRNYFAGETAAQAERGMGMVDRTSAKKVDSRLRRFEEKHLAERTPAKATKMKDTSMKPAARPINMDAPFGQSIQNEANRALDNVKSNVTSTANAKFDALAKKIKNG
jgi:hypothetical protein